jgi:hypothetical protein
MPANNIIDLSSRVGGLLGDWVLDPAKGGPLAGRDHAEVRAFAGAGKSHHLTHAVRRAVRRGSRILVIANTNNQVRDLALRIAALGMDVVHFAADGEEIINPPSRLRSTNERTALKGASCVVSTVYKAGKCAQMYANDMGNFDVGLVDEAYQVRTSTEALWALGLAPRWAFIGDAGQIEVFTTLGRSPFVGDDDPVTSIVDSARAQGANFGVLDFDWTWRLPAHGVAPLRSFYGQDVRAAALATDRQVVLGPTPAARGLAGAAGTCVRRTARTGWGYLELPGDALDPADPSTAEGVATIVSALLAHRPHVVCERDGRVLLAADQIGVAVSTDAQRSIVDQALSDAGVTGVEVRTYNRHQGLEYAVTVLWHPLSGVPDVDPFYMDLGRLCVGVTRHRHAAICVGRAGLRRLLEDPPVSPEAPWPGRRDRFLAGWLAHAELISHFDRIRATVAV